MATDLGRIHHPFDKNSIARSRDAAPNQSADQNNTSAMVTIGGRLFAGVTDRGLRNKLPSVRCNVGSQEQHDRSLISSMRAGTESD
jgi:hypothetical protein